MRASAIAYPFKGSLYLNLTNRCPVACLFCIKLKSDYGFQGHELLLDEEPEVEEAWKALEEAASGRRFSELVFCGLGEPTFRLDCLLELSQRAGERWPGVQRRLNTIGLGSAIWGRDISGELKESLDAVSVSLNTADPKRWVALHRPAQRYQDGFAAALSFIERCVSVGLAVTVTAVDLPGADVEGVRSLAMELGARFRLRPTLDPASQRA
ncbi:MAG: radical SAM protein [Elusimicrobia bacterium]|nr:radical SAM protein [Elusimicrobiota bacterium]